MRLEAGQDLSTRGEASRLLTLGEQNDVRECFTHPLRCPISFAEVSSSRDSDLD